MEEMELDYDLVEDWDSIDWLNFYDEHFAADLDLDFEEEVY